MKRKITLKNENETIVIENDSMEIIAKELVDKYTTKCNRSGLEHIVIIYKTNYILDYNELNESELMLFAECLSKYCRSCCCRCYFISFLLLYFEFHDFQT